MTSSTGPDPVDVPDQPALRPRYARIALLGASVVVTATAVLGGLGVLPGGGGASYDVRQGAAEQDDSTAAAASLSSAPTRTEDAARTGNPENSSSEDSGSADELSGDPTAPPTEEVDPEELLVPQDSGEGRRVVFDEGAQRVWLVEADGSVERTYQVSGSIYDNLEPGTYTVFSRDKEAWGIDGSELRYMVRFTTGAEAPIGFHNIPVLDGKKVQTPDELGTPLSHGCIRQWGEDAKALWDFAPLGTTVVVVDSSVPTPDQSEEG